MNQAYWELLHSSSFSFLQWLVDELWVGMINTKSRRIYNQYILFPQLLCHSILIFFAALSVCLRVFFQQFVASLCLTTKLLRPRLGLVSNKLKQMHINRQSLFHFSCSCSLPITLQRSSLSRYSEVGGSGFNLF